jgi:hypothetical protein
MADDGVTERSLYFDVNGQPITLERWSEMLGEMHYKRVGSTMVNDKRYWVSTVWLGLDHSHGFSVRPLIFETCVFDHHDLVENEFLRSPYPQSYVMQRYATADSAKRGHRRIIKKLREGIRPQDMDPIG